MQETDIRSAMGVKGERSGRALRVIEISLDKTSSSRVRRRSKNKDWQYHWADIGCCFHSVALFQVGYCFSSLCIEEKTHVLHRGARARARTSLECLEKANSEAADESTSKRIKY